MSGLIVAVDVHLVLCTDTIRRSADHVAWSENGRLHLKNFESWRNSGSHSLNMLTYNPIIGVELNRIITKHGARN